jgi:hypothetical protein
MRYVISLLFVIPLVACAKAEAPVSVSKISQTLTSNMNGDRLVPIPAMVEVTAKKDVTVQEVIVNRGNCPPYAFSFMFGKFPRSLKFGETLKVPATCDEILEAEVKTDKGDWTFTFEK